ncbi:MAG: hypothetical protein ACE149_17010 [Armatimonadota bacterium]
MAKPDRDPLRALERRRAWLIGWALFCCYSYFFYIGGNWNVESHYAQIYALAERGSLIIDDYPFLPPGGGDAAFYRGHYYSDKLIGPALLAAPIYRLLRETATASELSSRAAVYIALRFTNVAANALPSALLGALLYLFLAELGLATQLRVWLAFAYGLGTLAFPYSTVFFGHQLAAVAITGAFMLLWRQRREWSHRRAVAAGALAGFAAISDAMGIFLAALFGLYALWLAVSGSTLESRLSNLGRRIPPLAAAALAVFSLQLIANWSSFGSPLAFPHLYHAQAAFRERHTAGLFGIHLPQLYPLYQLTLGPWRGLFYGCPALLMALPGFLIMKRRWRAEAILCAASWLLVLLLNSGYENWTTGSAYGPRYQIVVLPLLIIAAATAAERWPLALKVLASISIAFMFIVTARSPFVDEGIQNPLRAIISRFSVSDLAQGNLGMLISFGTLQGLASLLPLLAAIGAFLLAIKLTRIRAASDSPVTRPSTKRRRT